MNLTDTQKTLLRLLVSTDESVGGKEFMLARSHTGAGLCYPGGTSVSVSNDDTDFLQLQRENCITLTRNHQGLLCGKPTQHGYDVAHRIGRIPVRVDSAFWRTLRQDFESLQSYKFDLFGSEGHWSWMDFPDESLKARLSAIALKGAKALGYDSEDAWYDELRHAEFVRSNMIEQRQPDSAMDSDLGPICDVVKESVTLCYTLEASVVFTDTLAEKSVATTAPNWQAIRRKFQQGAAAYPDLLAHWDSRDKLWTLRDGSQESDRLFKEAARIAVARAGKSGETAPSWHVWLDLMRNERQGFQPILQLRRWDGGRPIETGVIPSDAIATGNGDIAHVFEASAEYCADLESRERMTPVPPEAQRPRRSVDTAPSAPAPQTLIARNMVSSKPRLDVDLISKWMDHEGYDNKELADMLKISVRTVSSLRNNGNYHGEDAVTKLANLMKRDPEDLYLPEAST